jgi:predicted  nucleic acid-binding Zn-ribbon protein
MADTMTPDPLGSGLLDLVDLQEVDLGIDRLLHERETLPELSVYQEAAVRRDRLARTLAEKSEVLRSRERDLDKAEGELEILEIKLKESETRLFAGGMSGRETEQKRLEVQSLRGQSEAMETRVLGGIEVVDPLGEEARRLQDELESEKALVGKLEATIAEAWGGIDAQIARREATKKEMATPIAPELMSLYEQLRRSKDGVAIGRLINGVCGGCHLSLSLPEQAEAARWDPPRCIHCMRILVL